MDLEIDRDVKAVAEFMQTTLPAARLVSVAHAIAALAPILWGRYASEKVDALQLGHPQPNPIQSEILQPTANESLLGRTHVDGDFGLGRDAALPM